MRTAIERASADALESLEEALADRIRECMEEFVSDFWQEADRDDNMNPEIRKHLQDAFKRTMRYWELGQR